MLFDVNGHYTVHFKDRQGNPVARRVCLAGQVSAESKGAALTLIENQIRKYYQQFISLTIHEIEFVPLPTVPSWVLTTPPFACPN
jgi:hypothetical protein